MTTIDTPTPVARALGVAGLIPFVAGAAGAWLLPNGPRATATHALAIYAATIVAFLGGLHWGLAARGGQRATQYAWGVVPSLIAWGALLLPSPVALAALAVALVTCYVVDRRVLPAQGLAGWLGLRGLLTVVAAVSCLAGAAAA